MSTDPAVHKSHTSPVALILAKVWQVLLVLKRHWWLPTVLTLIGLGIAWWFSSQKPPSYVSYARMMVSGRIALPEGAIYSEELANFYGTQIELMQSSEVRRRAATRVETTRPELRPEPANISVGQQRGTSFFILTCTGREGQYAQALLDATMVEYMQFKREMRSDSADTAVTSVTDQLLKLDRELQAGEEELAAFRKRDDVVFLEEEGNSAGKYLVKLRQKLADLTTDHELLRLLDVDQQFEQRQGAKTSDGGKEGNSNSENPLGGGTEAAYASARQQIQLLQADLKRLGQVLRPKHPKMVKIAESIEHQQRLVELYREQATAQIETRRAGLALEIQNIGNEIKDWEVKALELNQKISEYNRLKSKVERTKLLSDRLLSTVQSVDVNKSLGQDVVTIMERASGASRTNPTLIKDSVTGGLAGVAIGLLVLVLLVVLDDRVNSFAEIQQSFDYEVIGQLPQESGAEPFDLNAMEEKHPMFAQASKNLRSSIIYMEFTEPRPRTFLVTSSIPGEGKSTIVASLAGTLADAGSRVLLVDGDLRKGRLHSLFGTAVSPGLTEVLRGEETTSSTIVSTRRPNLSLLPRGKFAPDASELYLGSASDAFLQKVYKDYDYILIDSAPILAAEDTASFAPKIDATLFVVRGGVASLRKTRAAIDILEKRNANIVGLVFNSASIKASDYYYYGEYREAAVET